MMFMHEYEIMDAAEKYMDHPVLGPATKTLLNLMYWTDAHSDGWAYWPKPCRAAKQLQEILTYKPGGDITERVKAAYKPIRAFKTRENADFEIVEG